APFSDAQDCPARRAPCAVRIDRPVRYRDRIWAWAETCCGSYRERYRVCGVSASNGTIMPQAAGAFPSFWFDLRPERMRQGRCLPGPFRGGASRTNAALILRGWWRGLDSNQCSLRRQIYSLMDLTTLPPLHILRQETNALAFRRAVYG